VPLIAGLIARDAPFYDAAISPEAVEGLSKFALASGLTPEPVAYEQLVATQFRNLWNA
jgi:NitT/TauT family transport system substrate-binding protein